MGILHPSRKLVIWGYPVYGTSIISQSGCCSLQSCRLNLIYLIQLVTMIKWGSFIYIYIFIVVATFSKFESDSSLVMIRFCNLFEVRVRFESSDDKVCPAASHSHSCHRCRLLNFHVDMRFILHAFPGLSHLKIG